MPLRRKALLINEWSFHAGARCVRGGISRGGAKTRRHRLGEFLKELELTEGRATGIPIILKALKDNGSLAPRFLTDSNYSFFEVELFIHPAFVSKTPLVLDLDTMVWDIHGIDELLERLLLGIDEGVSGDIANDRAKTIQKYDNQIFKIKDTLAGDTVGDIAGGISRGIAEKMIQVLLWAGTPIERKELLKAIGLSGNVKNYNTYIAPLVAINWLAMTIPDKPTSPNQKYLITLKGTETHGLASLPRTPARETKNLRAMRPRVIIDTACRVSTYFLKFIPNYI